MENAPTPANDDWRQAIGAYKPRPDAPSVDELIERFRDTYGGTGAELGDDVTLTYKATFTVTNPWPTEVLGPREEWTEIEPRR